MRKVSRTLSCLFIGAILSITMLDARAVHGQQAPPLKDETASSSPVVPADDAPREPSQVPSEINPSSATPTPSDASNTRLTRAEREALSERIDRAAKSGDTSVQGSREVSTGYGSLLLQMVISLGIVCLLAYLLLRYGLKRLLPDQNQKGQMEVLARLPLEPRRTLLVVKVGEKVLVLASSESGIQPVSELSAEEAAIFLEQAEDGGDTGNASKKPFSLVLKETDAAPENAPAIEPQ